MRNAMEDYLDVYRFQSLKFSELFFKNFTDFCFNNNLAGCTNRMQEFRTKVAQMIALLNANGGFTLIGWYKAGTVGDASNNDNGERGTNTDVTIHLSYLQPTNRNYIAASDAYKALMIE